MPMFLSFLFNREHFTDFTFNEPRPSNNAYDHLKQYYLSDNISTNATSFPTECMGNDPPSRTNALHLKWRASNMNLVHISLTARLLIACFFVVKVSEWHDTIFLSLSGFIVCVSNLVGPTTYCFINLTSFLTLS